MQFKKKENSKVWWWWNLVYTTIKSHETGMKLHWKDLKFIYTHSSISIGHMVYLIINTNQQFYETVRNYALRSCGFILVSEHDILGNCVMTLCTKIGLTDHTELVTTAFVMVECNAWIGNALLKHVLVFWNKEILLLYTE